MNSVNKYYSTEEDNSWESIRSVFPTPNDVNEDNLILFSTSGVHGSYRTIEEIRENCKKAGVPLSENTQSITYVLIQPRIVHTIYGVVVPKSEEDLKYLNELRLKSRQELQFLGGWDYFDEEAPPKLCYIKGSFAYFTTQKLEDQYGDDWTRTSYDMNAGEPYTPNEKDGEFWSITKVAFICPNAETPVDICYNCSHSVRDINKHITPWLVADRWSGDSDILFAGVDVMVFKRFIEKHGGEVYLKDL